MDQKLEEIKKGLSVRWKTLILIGAMLVLVVAVTLVATLAEVRNVTIEQEKEYLFDLTESNGRILEQSVAKMGLDKALDTGNLEKIFKDVSLGNLKSSYAYVVGNDSIMRYHPTASKIGQPVENSVVKGIVADINAGKEVKPAVVEYEFKGEIKYAGTYVGKDNSFIVVISADRKEIFALVSHITLLMIIIGVVVGVLGLLAAFILMRKMIIRPLIRFSEIIDRMGELDFSHADELEEFSKSKDEIGVMARKLQALHTELIKVVSEIKEQSDKLHNSSQHLTKSANVSAETIKQVDEAVSDMANGATSQASDTQHATDSVIIIGNMVQETNKEVAMLRENVRIMNDAGDEASKTLKELEVINGDARNSIDEIYRQTNTTNESAMKIKDAISLITSIAEETNLLSLNASIEAARAGEQGRGFAVVASQIQKLAEQSNESAMKVQDITNMLMEDSEKAVETMEKVKKIMESQMDKVDITGTMFAKVQDEIELSMEGITHIADKTVQMDEARVNVVDIVQNLTAIAEENAAGTEETSASVTEITGIVHDISNDAKLLHDVAFVLDGEMKRFNIK